MILNIPYVFAVAGGKSKAKAIPIYEKRTKQTWLITDEAAANVILKVIPLKIKFL